MRKRLLTRAGGFTLIELMVVIIIIGILVGVAIPQFAKTLESSKATDAALTLQQVAAANRMFKMDHANRYANGSSPISTACNTGTCASLGCDGVNPPACCLTACNYLAKVDWDGKSYLFYTAGTATGAGGQSACSSAAACDSSSAGPGADIIACAVRKTTGDLGSTSSPFMSWGYAVDKNGVIGCIGTPPDGMPPAPPR